MIMFDKQYVLLKHIDMNIDQKYSKLWLSIAQTATSPIYWKVYIY